MKVKVKYFPLVLALVFVIMSLASLGLNIDGIKEDKMILQLMSSEFTNGAQTPTLTGAGLSNPWNVGVDKDKFEKEVLYSSVGEGAVHTINATQFGVNGADKLDDSKGVSDAICAAKTYQAQEGNAGKTVKIVLPKGDLDFIQGKNPTSINYAIDLSNCSNIILQGEDTTLYMYGEMSAILIEQSNNILIRGINIDWGRVPFSVGKVVEKSADLKTVTVKVNEGYPIDSSTKIQAYLEFDQFTYLPREDGNDIYPAGIEGASYIGNQEIEIRFKNSIKSVPNNTLVVLRHKLYENDAIFANQSKDLFFETVNIYSAPGMGIRAYTCDNLYFNRFSTKLKPNTDRLMTVTADAIHTIDCKGDLKITNSIFENRGDDAVNTHGMYLKIGEKLAENKIFAYNPRGYHFAPEVGDTIEVSRRSDLTVVQTLTVKSVALDEGGDGYIVEFKENLSGDVVASKDINDGDVICNPSRSTKLIFQNNIVRNSRCRGILIQTREALVENNTFANMSDAAILITSDTGAWYESLPSQNVTIRNNKIIGNNRSLSGSQGDITAICFGSDNSLGATGLQKNFEISNNFIANGKRAGIFLNSISGVNISHNLIHNVGSKANIAMYDTALGFSNAKDVVINKNTINPNSGSTFKPVYIGTGAETDTFTVTDNVGLTINDVIPSIKQASKVGKTTATINFDDKSLLDWTSVGTIVAMVGKTDVDQEIVVPTEKDFNNWLKMAWKDDGIYYAYSVTDDELVFNDTAQYWFGDGVEMFITTNTTSQSSMGTIKVTEPSCAQLFMSPSKTGCIISEARTSDEVLANKNLIKMKSWLKADNSGYEGEGFIPFNAIPNLKNAVETGSEVSFCVNFFDVDKTGKQISVSNADAPVENNKYVPGRMPKIKFVTEG